jgi:hypothetical protein
MGALQRRKPRACCRPWQGPSRERDSYGVTAALMWSIDPLPNFHKLRGAVYLGPACGSGLRARRGACLEWCHNWEERAQQVEREAGTRDLAEAMASVDGKGGWVDGKGKRGRCHHSEGYGGGVWGKERGRKRDDVGNSWPKSAVVQIHVRVPTGGSL